MARLISIFVAILWVGVLGCYVGTGYDGASWRTKQEAGWGQEYNARVGRVEVPDVVRVGSSFDLGIYDGLGCPNKFVRFEVYWHGCQVTVAVIGVRPPEPVMCPMNAPPPKARILTIKPSSCERVEVVVNPMTEYERRLIVDLTDRRPN